MIIRDTASAVWSVGRAQAGRDVTSEDPETDALYKTKEVYRDPLTHERGSLVSCASGFAVPARYHDSAEEGLFLSGECNLANEGIFRRGCYFWRPAGWIHQTLPSAEPWTALIFMHGVDLSEGSGGATDVSCPETDVGLNGLHEDKEEAIGPRGWVKNLDVILVPWHNAATNSFSPDFILGWLGEKPNVDFKVLSRNAATTAQSVLVRLPKGFSSECLETPMGGETDLFVVSGRIEVADTELGPGGYVRFAGTPSADRLSSSDGATLFVRACRRSS